MSVSITLKQGVLCAAVALGLAMASPAAAHVDLHAPDGAEVLVAGSVFTVEWEIEIKHDLQNWDLWYSTISSSGPWIVIDMDLPPGSDVVGSMHAYDWTIPAIVSDDTWARVRMDNSGTDYFDVSNASFAIVPEPNALLLLGLGVAGLLGIRRRRRAGGARRRRPITRSE